MIKAIVTTTINKPTKALLKYIEIGERDGWTLFIVGDRKTPHEDYLLLAQQHPNVAYISPSKQESKYARLSELIGWDCIQRRNIGFVEAYNFGADVIATVDDDNVPYDNWGQSLAIGKRPHVAAYDSQEIVFDPMQATNMQELWHRGFPIQMVNGRRAAAIGAKDQRRVMVQADLWDGEPDVDAVCRIAKGPFDCRFNVKGFFAGVQPGPFNSQNTFLSRECFPTYFMFPHIGRMDDIWASYLLQRDFPGSTVYGPASVYQERNPHNLARDLEQELIGYKHTLAFCESLFSKPAAERSAWEGFLPTRALQAYMAYKELFMPRNVGTEVPM
jgi:hypothetical protein